MNSARSRVQGDSAVAMLRLFVARHAARALPTAPRLLVSAGWTSSTPRVAAAAATAAVAFGAGASVFSQCDASKSEGSCLVLPPMIEHPSSVCPSFLSQRNAHCERSTTRLRC